MRVSCISDCEVDVVQAVDHFLKYALEYMLHYGALTFIYIYNGSNSTCTSMYKLSGLVHRLLVGRQVPQHGADRRLVFLADQFAVLVVRTGRPGANILYLALIVT